MTAATVVRHACARCGKKQKAEQMVFSSHTRKRYCSDLGACGRRARRVSA